ncbi:P-loop containing nucleoside triphosphate hydrolase protein [Lipomyces oligophaga]|uniref:P-loop containing nucleoside triphosphate hydrolase protein n=1 Tax=Lipomyces oligophaga TaxID=45792 RepID=UPI0034CDD9C5
MDEQLPITKIETQLVEHLKRNQITILVGETGSGKSTQVPQIIYRLDRNERIAITQPRRVAAINLARRVAEETKTELGQEVGYTVRFQNKSSSQTRIKFLTDGMLLRELLVRSNLRSYSTIIIDEAHERTVVTDLLLGFLKQLTASPSSSNPRIIIMSATLDAERFSKFFNGAQVLYVEGRKFPVARFYLDQPVQDIVDAVVRAVVQINIGEESGDILAFLSGQEDIDQAVDMLNKIKPSMPKGVPEMVVFPLYAALAPMLQMKVFDRIGANTRKIILATNIAETSLTIPGVRYVIDSGIHKVKVWRHDLGLDSLLTVPIAKANAAQRLGRAGREAPGKCFRLYTEKDYTELNNQSEPEIERTDVAFPILTLKSAGVADIMGWSWLERPTKGAIISAMTQLYALKALDDSGNITPLGTRMAIFPLPPHLSVVLLTAQEAGIADAVLDIVSCLSIENLLMNPRPDQRDQVNESRLPFVVAAGGMGDLIVLRNYILHYKSLKNADEKKAWCKEVFINARAMSNVEDIRNQLARYLKNTPTNEGSAPNGELNDRIVECFLKGYVNNTALAVTGRTFKTIATGQSINIHPSSSVFGTKSSAIMYTEYIYTTKAYARNVTPIDLDAIQKIAPHFLGRRSAGSS